MKIFKLHKKYGDGYEKFMLQQLVPINSYMTQDDLGIEEDVVDMLIKETYIIVNQLFVFIGFMHPQSKVCNFITCKL